MEKINGMICKIITKQLGTHPHTWDKHLNDALWAHSTSFCTSLGFTHFHLIYGQEAILPIEVELASLQVQAINKLKPMDKLKERILQLELLQLDREQAVEYYCQQAEKRRENLNKRLMEKNLEEGHQVLRYDNRFDHKKGDKFLHKWEGPFFILKKYDNGSYMLQDLSNKVHHTRVNGWRLKPYFQLVEGNVEEGFQKDQGFSAFFVQQQDGLGA